jgi:hypothetical protein
MKKEETYQQQGRLHAEAVKRYCELRSRREGEESEDQEKTQSKGKQRNIIDERNKKKRKKERRRRANQVRSEIWD